MAKNSSVSAGDGKDGFNPWIGKIPWSRNCQSIPVLFPGKPHGQKSLVGYGPWGCKELDMTKWLSTQPEIPLGHTLFSFWLYPLIFISFVLHSIESVWDKTLCLYIYIYKFIYFNCRLITLQYCSAFCYTLTWIRQGCTCVPQTEPRSHLLPHPIRRVIPVHQLRSPCVMHQTWTGDLFHIGNIHASMSFSQIIPPSPSPTESKSLTLCI